MTTLRIVTLGLTPAWQKVMLFDCVTLDAANRASHVCWCVSGKNANVAIAAATLLRDSGDSVLVTPAGGGSLDNFRRELTDLGIDLRLVETAAATRTCTTLISRGDSTVTELVEEGGSLTPDERDAIVTAAHTASRSADVVVVTGSLCAGLPNTFYLDLVAEVPANTPIIADIRGEGLLHLLQRRPYLVKPNRSELATTMDWLKQQRGDAVPTGEEVLGSDEAMSVAMEWLHRAGAQHVVITEGKRGVWVLAASCKLQHFAAIPIQIDEQCNPIGCGDAMTGGIAWGTAQRWDVVRSVQAGLACAAINLRDILPCRLDPEEVLRNAAK